MVKIEENQAYQIKATKLLAAIPNASIDALITDLPYSSGGMTSSSRKAPPEYKYINSKGLYQTFTGDNRDQRS